MTDYMHGRRWARTFLALALFVSMVGNVAHTVLADSAISLWLRVPGAVVWPVFTFGGIEIIVRMIWERKWTHSLARNMVLFPAVPAAIVSYQHLYSLLLMMGEEHFIAYIGPAAIDGMMIGCTMALLFTRPVPPEILATQLREPVTVAATVEQPATLELEPELDIALPSLAKPTGRTVTIRPRQPRARATSMEEEKAVLMLMEGKSAAKVHEIIPTISQTTAGRVGTVLRKLMADPTAIIPTADRVRPELVAYIREQVRR